MFVTEETFCKIVEDTWASTLQFQIDRPTSAESSAKGGLAVGVTISGQWNGAVYLSCPLPLARLIAAAIFQVEADKAGDDEILDALSELIHIVGGNLKALLPQPVSVSLPTEVSSPMGQATAREPGTVCRLELSTKGYPFVISLSENAESDMLNPTPGSRERSVPAEPRHAS